MTKEQLDTLESLVRPTTEEQRAALEVLKQDMKVLQAQVYYLRLRIDAVRDACLSRPLTDSESDALRQHVEHGLYAVLREDSQETIVSLTQTEMRSMSITELIDDAGNYEFSS